MTNPVRTIDTHFAVAVTVWLPQSVFKTLNQQASRSRTTVGELIAVKVLDVQYTPRPQPYRERIDPDTLNQIVKLRQAGRTLQEIADITGVSLTTVHRRIKRLGLGQP